MYKQAYCFFSKQNEVIPCKLHRALFYVRHFHFSHLRAWNFWAVTLLQNRRFTFSLSIFPHSLEDIFASKFQNDWFAERTAPSVGTENVYDLQPRPAQRGSFVSTLNSYQLILNWEVNKSRFKKSKQIDLKSDCEKAKEVLESKSIFKAIERN